MSLLPSEDGGLTMIKKIFSEGYLPVILTSDHEFGKLEAFSRKSGALTLMSRSDITTDNLERTIDRAMEEAQHSMDVREKIGTFEVRKTMF